MKTKFPKRSHQPKERRACSRVKLDDLAVITTSDKQEKPVIIKDISRKGVGIEANFPLRPQGGYLISLYSALFQVEAKKHFRCVWCRKADEHLWVAGMVVDGPLNY